MKFVLVIFGCNARSLQQAVCCCLLPAKERYQPRVAFIVTRRFVMRKPTNLIKLWH